MDFTPLYFALHCVSVNVEWSIALQGNTLWCLALHITSLTIPISAALALKLFYCSVCCVTLVQTQHYISLLFPRLEQGNRRLSDFTVVE